ncbi:MAG: hypothetical protein FWD22_03915 [Treponema sp.]|nr:hypothetical protein [Treponema sp.]
MSTKCQSCGAFHTRDALIKGEICPTCDGPYTIRKLQTIAAMPLPQVNKCISIMQTQLAEQPADMQLNLSMGICFLKLKQLEKALSFFDKAMIDNFSDPNPYYYASICLLKGKKAFLAMRDEIEKIETNLESANSLEPRPIFYYFQAYIKYDYYSRKSLNTSPTWEAKLEEAKNAGLMEDEVAEFYALIGVERPSCI